MKKRFGEWLAKAGQSAAKKNIVMLLKVGFSLGFLAILIRTVPLSEVLDLFKNLDLYYVAILLLLSYIMLVESCLKWGLLLRIKQIRESLHYLVKLYVLGNFFNNFLPSMVGGDSARGLILGRKTGKRTDVFLSIFMERLTGYFALIFIASLTVLINHPLVNIGNLRSVVLLLLVSSLVVVWMIFSRRFFHLLMNLLPRKFSKIRAKIDMAHVSLLEFSHHKSKFVLVLLLSLLFHLLTGLNLYYACLALHYQPDLLSMIVVTPFILLLSLLPITINGIGLWESAFVLFFSLLGLPKSLALSVALLLRMKNLLISALGGIFYLQEGRTVENSAEIQND